MYPLFSFTAECDIPLCGYTIILKIHSPVDRYLVCFQFGAIKIQAARDICEQIFVWTYAFVSLG